MNGLEIRSGFVSCTTTSDLPPPRSNKNSINSINTSANIPRTIQNMVVSLPVLPPPGPETVSPVAQSTVIGGAPAIGFSVKHV